MGEFTTHDTASMKARRVLLDAPIGVIPDDAS